MKISARQLKRIVREERRKISEQVAVPNNGGAPPAAEAPGPQIKQKRWKTEITSDYDAGYAAGMADEDPSEEASRSWDDGYTDAFADIAAEEEAAAAAQLPPMENIMRITRKQLRETIKEMQMIREDSIDTELDHLKKNVADDLDHIKDLKDDVKDDHEEELRAEKEKERKDESLRRRAKKVGYTQLRKMIREMQHEQGYDDREDERLAAEHGGEDEHEQDYKDRRDDAEFEEREGSHIEVHHHHHESLKRRLRRIVRENTRRRRR